MWLNKYNGSIFQPGVGVRVWVRVRVRVRVRISVSARVRRFVVEQVRREHLPA